MPDAWRGFLERFNQGGPAWSQPGIVQFLEDGRRSSGGRCKRRTVTVTRTRLGLFERTRLKITTNDSEP